MWLWRIKISFFFLSFTFARTRSGVIVLGGHYTEGGKACDVVI